MIYMFYEISALQKQQMHRVTSCFVSFYSTNARLSLGFKRPPTSPVAVTHQQGGEPRFDWPSRMPVISQAAALAPESGRCQRLKLLP